MKDTAGDTLTDAVFLLLDTAGRQAGSASTDGQGMLTFSGLAPGVYRLKETSTGSQLHELAADQDVIVTRGATTPLTITDPFKPAILLVQAKDATTGEPLSGVTVQVGTGNPAILTLTTGARGIASGRLPVSARTTVFWVKETKVPSHHQLDNAARTVSAGPGASVTLAFTSGRTVNVTNPDQQGKPKRLPVDRPSNTTTDAGTLRPAPTTQARTLAQTGANATPWLVAGAGTLVAAGGTILLGIRRRAHRASATGDHSKII